jgi:hypothetical protein
VYRSSGVVLSKDAGSVDGSGNSREDGNLKSYVRFTKRSSIRSIAIMAVEVEFEDGVGEDART